MPLRKEDIERIEREAKALYPNPNAAKQSAYISGATAEAEKANELVEVLNRILKIDDAAFGLRGFNVSKLKSEIQTAITNYKK